jgi:hypothetical protein
MCLRKGVNKHVLVFSVYTPDFYASLAYYGICRYQNCESLTFLGGVNTLYLYHLYLFYVLHEIQNKAPA